MHVPEGELAPSNYTQIGPGLFYPAPASPDTAASGAAPPPPPAQWPLDKADITYVGPGQLGPYGIRELLPGYFAPNPSAYDVTTPPWPQPQQPIDVRDVINVPKGQLAPFGYVEYFPGWFVPGTWTN